MSSTLSSLAEDKRLNSRDARVLLRVTLASYFAGAVLMPYAAFYEAAEEERYDIETLCNRFQTSFEQVTHRLTTLRRPGSVGVPFHFIRIDIAGNISKRFSASGIQFARFGSACSRWNVYASLMTPGRLRRQVSLMPDGTAYFCVARATRKARYKVQNLDPLQAIGLGCTIDHAPRLVYSDGIDLSDVSRNAVPIGTSCRTCERMNCAQRAFPSLHRPIRIRENIRGISFFSTDQDESA